MFVNNDLFRKTLSTCCTNIVRTDNFQHTGTCVTHEFPNVGKEIGAVPILKKLIERGHKLILHTMRGKDTIDAAKNWFDQNNIPLYGINSNPTQWRWTNSKKVFAQLYIDDAALGVPLKLDTSISSRPFVDWDEVAKLLINLHII